MKRGVEEDGGTMRDWRREREEGKEVSELANGSEARESSKGRADAAGGSWPRTSLCSSSSHPDSVLLTSLKSRSASSVSGCIPSVVPVSESAQNTQGRSQKVGEIDGKDLKKKTTAGSSAGSSAGRQAGDRKAEELRRVSVPPHRYSPLKAAWLELIQPLVSHMGLHVRMNIRRRCVELKASSVCQDPSRYLQRGFDYVSAFLLGFEVQDALALLRLDDLFVDSFEIADVKRLHGGHLSRCIGRISGKEGKTKFAIENATRTRIVLADRKIHLLGSFQSIKLARDAICSLILGSPCGKVYNRLRAIASRLRER